MPTSCIPCFVPSDPTGASIQSALDAANANGGIVYLDKHLYTIEEPLVIRGSSDSGFVDRGVQLIGACPEGTIIQAAPEISTDLLWIHSSRAAVKGVTFVGAEGGGRGIIVGTPGWYQGVSRVHLEDCIVRGTTGNALRFLGAFSGTSGAEQCTIRSCEFHLSETWASAETLVVESGNLGHRFEACRFWSLSSVGVRVLGCPGIRFEDCSMEGAGSQPLLLAAASPWGMLDHCWLEQAETASQGAFLASIQEQSHAWSSYATLFGRGPAAGTSLRALTVTAGGSTPPRGVCVISPRLRTLGGSPSSQSDGHIKIAGTTAECHTIGGMIGGGADLAIDTPLQINDQSQTSCRLGGNRRLRVPGVYDPNSVPAPLANPAAGQIVFALDEETPGPGKLMAYSESEECWVPFLLY